VDTKGGSDATTLPTLPASDGNGVWVELCCLSLPRAGDFRIDTTSGWPYLRLRSNSVATITATIAARELRSPLGPGALRQSLGRQAVTTPWTVGRMLPPASLAGVAMLGLDEQPQPSQAVPVVLAKGILQFTDVLASLFHAPL
jgi:hypothetical protein